MTASRRTILRGLAAAPLATLPVVVKAPVLAASGAFHPDAALLDLGRQWASLAARYDAASEAVDAMPDFADSPPTAAVVAALAACAEIDRQCEALQAEIARAQATTLDGILLKARVVSWLNGHDLAFQIDRKMQRGEGGSDDAILLTIARDLLAMSGGAA